MEALKTLGNVPVSDKTTYDIPQLQSRLYAAMDDDFNTPVLIAELFDVVRYINSVNDGKEFITNEDKSSLSNLLSAFVHDVLGLKDDIMEDQSGTTDGLMQLIIRMRADARTRKDFGTSDLIRDELAKLNIVLKDGKQGTSWEIKS
jgi:cysteinyl-tRNA synthetase